MITSPPSLSPNDDVEHLGSLLITIESEVYLLAVVKGLSEELLFATLLVSDACIIIYLYINHKNKYLPNSYE